MLFVIFVVMIRRPATFSRTCSSSALDVFYIRVTCFLLVVVVCRPWSAQGCCVLGVVCCVLGVTCSVLGVVVCSVLGVVVCRVVGVVGSVVGVRCRVVGVVGCSTWVGLGGGVLIW